ncbi:MAG: hypothetical protein H6719_18295 [Sandaracinaceae bacterium]|nr:hypothetical protein [Sandaracinaceae bacterium]
MTVGRLAIAALVLAGGCSSEQPWVFQNGTGLPDEAPARIVAEVYEGAECGFACRPPGRRVYCSSVSSGDRGPSPTGLSDGERYCFLGTAFDAAGDTIGVGCEVATVGGGPITITLSPSDEARQSACVDGPDASLPDAGPRDGGAPSDAGPPVGGPVVLTIESGTGGGFLVQNVRTGRGWNVGSNVRFNLNTEVGNTYAIYPQVSSGFRFDAFEGGGCGAFIPCELLMERDTLVRLSFVQL